MHYSAKDIISFAQNAASQTWTRYCSGEKDYWEYIEFGSKRGNWDRYRRAIYCRLINGGDQLYLPGCRPDTLIITNIGQGQHIDALLNDAGAAHYLQANGIMGCYHERGSDELANRALKDFGHEQLPFKRFNPNAAWYYSMLLGHFLMECFKEDVATSVVPVGAYANTVRRRLIDIAGNIVFHSDKMILKVSAACFKSLGLSMLLERCKAAPVIH